MMAPKLIFLDTNIFDGGNYNFDSKHFSAFVASARGKVTLLLPDPTEREIRRHLKQRSQEAAQALEAIPRKAPFIANWKKWPLRGNIGSLDDELHGLLVAAWDAFLGNFDVDRIGYEGIDMRSVMDWYDAGRPPFGPGKKAKEFPDALALACILNVVKDRACEVAIVTADKEFRDACADHNELLRYSSLAALTEALLSEQVRVSEIRALLDAELSGGSDVFVQAIAERFGDLFFYTDGDSSGDAEDAEADEVVIEDLSVISLGESECTVAFNATVSYFVHVHVRDPDSVFRDDDIGDYIFVGSLSGRVRDTTTVSGTAKVALSDDRTRLGEVIQLDFDEVDVAVKARPTERDY